MTQGVSNEDIYSPASQLNQRREIISQLPDHLRRVLPPEGDSNNNLSLPQLDDAVKLLLIYDDCFVGASDKVGWTDRATHSIDTGINRPV